MTERYKLAPIELTREMWEASGDEIVKLGHVHHDKITGAVYPAMMSQCKTVEVVDFETVSIDPIAQEIIGKISPDGWEFHQLIKCEKFMKEYIKSQGIILVREVDSE